MGQVELSQILEIDEVGQVLANQFTLYMTWYFKRSNIGSVDFELLDFQMDCFSVFAQLTERSQNLIAGLTSASSSTI